MTIRKINEHQVDVPDDFIAVNETGFAGAHDYLVYRGIGITTLELDKEPELYTGPFAILGQELEILDVPDLDTVRQLIDQHLAEKVAA